jgi:predicted transcriptional regulator
MNNTNLHIRIPQELVDRVKAVAASLDRSASWTVRKAIIEYCERNEK